MTRPEKMQSSLQFVFAKVVKPATMQYISLYFLFSGDHHGSKKHSGFIIKVPTFYTYEEIRP